jgi:hypothetical protein
MNPKRAASDNWTMFPRKVICPACSRTIPPDDVAESGSFQCPYCGQGLRFAKRNHLLSAILSVIGAATTVVLSPRNWLSFYFFFLLLVLVFNGWRQLMLPAKLELEPPDDFHRPLP